MTLHYNKSIITFLLAGMFYLIPQNILAQGWIMKQVNYATTNTNTYNISIVDQNIAWTIASLGYYNNPMNEFSRTTDGGQTWQSGTVPLASTYLNVCIDALDENTAYTVAYNLQSPKTFIYKTTDGGLNWAVVDSGNIYAASNSVCESVHFWNAAHGIAIGDAVNGYMEIYTTTDSGNTWALVPNANMPAAQSGEATDNMGVAYHGSNVWVTTSKGRAFVSNDYGVTWNVYSLGTVGYPGLTMQSDDLHGFVVINTLNNLVYANTSDGGVTWNTITPTGTVGLMHASIPGTNIIVGANGDPYGFTPYGSSYSVDNGLSWTTIDSSGFPGPANGYSCLSFLDINTGYAGSMLNAISGGIYKWFPGSVGISTVADDELNAFPNPATDIMYVQNIPANSKLSIYDLTGRVVFTQDAFGLNTIGINVESLSDGVYVLKIENGNKIVQKKIAIR